jgi:sec-independent protein translocase protein TatA
MGGLSIWHIVILAGVAILLFGGRGKISDLMGDVAKGIRSFREGLNDPNDAKTINTQPNPTPAPAPNKDQTPVG